LLANYAVASTALETPAATALPALTTASFVLLANYLAASAAPLTPSLANYPNFAAAALAS